MLLLLLLLLLAAAVAGWAVCPSFCCVHQKPCRCWRLQRHTQAQLYIATRLPARQYANQDDTHSGKLTMDMQLCGLL
jgi:hypothetical protein